MKMRTIAFAAAGLTAALANTGCSWRKAKAAPPPAVIKAAPQKAQEPIPPAPPVDSTTPVSQLPAPPISAPVPEPVKPEQAPPPRRAARTAPPPSDPTPAPVEAPAEPHVPQLVQLLSREEQERHNRELDDFTRRAEESLQRIGDRQLSGQQRTDVQRARAFLKQAQELRATDLVTARNLAQRADVLADSVARALR